MSMIFSDCISCKHLHKGIDKFYEPVFKCDAFPDGIPQKVLDAEKKLGQICYDGIGYEEILIKES